jgi:ubiquinone/menaquinone biosynthesis C-methylase UbiE
MATGLKRLYDRRLLPKLVHWSCGLEPLTKQRTKIVPLASGRVLEVGFGSGLNLPFYDATRIERLLALEPAAEMMRIARGPAARAPFTVELLRGRAEQLPLPAESMDAVVITYTLCTIPRPLDGLAEIRRVLRRGGRLLFCEHGLAPDASVRRWQKRLNLVWRPLAGGCNLDRDVAELIRRAGFSVSELSTMYLPGWRPAGFNSWGVAVPAVSPG